MEPIKRLTIVGCGLIGGSLARALKEAGKVDVVVGTGRREEPLRQAQALGVVDEWTTDLAAAVKGAEVVVLCTPLGAMRKVLEAIAPRLDEQTILTDVGSAKGSVVQDVAHAFGHLPANFVPGHPIAGTEKSGVEASFATLYHDRRVILTPLPSTDSLALARVNAMWKAAGAQVVEMSVTHHDDILAATSHLPHMLAFGLVDTLSRWDDNREIFEFAAGGFRDFTRIASSDPVMWRDICMANREALMQAIQRYMDDLELLLDLVRQRDGDKLENVFRNAREQRARFLKILEGS